jgi:hypothetical protein
MKGSRSWQKRRGNHLKLRGSGSLSEQTGVHVGEDPGNRRAVMAQLQIASLLPAGLLLPSEVEGNDEWTETEKPARHLSAPPGIAWRMTPVKKGEHFND